MRVSSLSSIPQHQWGPIPRRVEHWAKSYKDKAAKRIAQGKRKPAGLQSIAAAKASGGKMEPAGLQSIAAAKASGL